MLSGQLSRLDRWPELKEQIRGHLEETTEQTRRLKISLDRLGEGSSMIKDAGGKLTAMAQSISGIFAGDDEGVSGQLHVRTYGDRFLHHSHRCGSHRWRAEVARVCEQKLREEEAMAEWLKINLPKVTETFLGRADADRESAKR